MSNDCITLLLLYKNHVANIYVTLNFTVRHIVLEWIKTKIFFVSNTTKISFTIHTYTYYVIKIKIHEIIIPITVVQTRKKYPLSMLVFYEIYDITFHTNGNSNSVNIPITNQREIQNYLH